MLYALLLLVRDSIPHPLPPPLLLSPSILYVPLISFAILSHSPLLSPTDCPEAPPCWGAHDWCVSLYVCVCLCVCLSIAYMITVTLLVSIWSFPEQLHLITANKMKWTDVLQVPWRYFIGLKCIKNNSQLNLWMNLIRMVSFFMHFIQDLFNQAGQQSSYFAVTALRCPPSWWSAGGDKG